MEKLVYGVGIVDLEYPKTRKVNGVVVWRCKVYESWTNMLQRCYSEERAKETEFLKKPSCSDTWKLFSNFKNWMDSYEHTGLHLDKDILIAGNREYGPNSCAFVPRYLNNLLNIRQMSRGDCPLGVRRTTHWRQKQYNARVGDKNLGYFLTPQEAHAAWQLSKAAHIEDTVAKYASEPCFRTDVTESLISRAWLLRLYNLKGIETFYL